MSYHANKHEIPSVCALTVIERYSYFIGIVADWEELWSVKRASGWRLFGDSKGNECIPVWPAPEYADLCCVGEFQDSKPALIALDEFLAYWIPGMVRDGKQVAVFPLPNDTGIVVSPEQFARDVRELHLDLHGEE